MDRAEKMKIMVNKVIPDEKAHQSQSQSAIASWTDNVGLISHRRRNGFVAVNQRNRCTLLFGELEKMGIWKDDYSPKFGPNKKGTFPNGACPFLKNGNNFPVISSE